MSTARLTRFPGTSPRHVVPTAAYCASKGAVVLLTKQVAVEYAEDKIHCNALCPGCEFPLPAPFNVESYTRNLI